MHPIQRAPEIILRAQSSQAVKLTNHLHIAPRFGMSGCKSTLHSVPSCRAQAHPYRCLHHSNTGRFIMFSVITNIYNKKTKGPTLMELFTATGKLKKFFFFFLTTRDIRRVHHGWHDTHRYDIQVLRRLMGDRLISAWTDTQFQKFIPRANGLVCRRVLCILCTKCTLHSNHRLTRVIFQHTKHLLPRSGHFLTTYTLIA